MERLVSFSPFVQLYVYEGVSIMEYRNCSVLVIPTDFEISLIFFCVCRLPQETTKSTQTKLFHWEWVNTCGKRLHLSLSYHRSSFRWWMADQALWTSRIPASSRNGPGPQTSDFGFSGQRLCWVIWWGKLGETRRSQEGYTKEFSIRPTSFEMDLCPPFQQRKPR